MEAHAALISTAGQISRIEADSIILALPAVARPKPALALELERSSIPTQAAGDALAPNKIMGASATALAAVRHLTG